MKSKDPDISWTISNENDQCTHIGFTEHVFDAIHYSPWLRLNYHTSKMRGHRQQCFQGTGRPAGRPGTNRDGTSRCPFVPGQKKILVPVSRCPGTRAGANVPGQTPLSRPVPGQNDLKIFKKRDQISHFRTSFLCFRTSFPVLERPFLFQSILFLFQNVLFCSVPFCPASRPGFWLSRPVPSRILAVPTRPVPWQDFQLVPLSLCPGTMMEFLSRCPEKFHCPVPLETLIWTIHEGRTGIPRLTLLMWGHIKNVES